MLSAVRVKFVRDITKRFDWIAKLITESIVKNDCFGLLQTNAAAGKNQFAFTRSSDKVSAFMEWLQQQINLGILEVGPGQRIGSSIDNAWTNVYIKQSYSKGVLRAQKELKKAGYSLEVVQDTGALRFDLGGGAHLDRIGSLYTRAFEELKGITAAMEKQISTVLSDGLVNGENPRLIARQLDAVIKTGGGELGLTDKLGRYIPARRRAEMLARTEITRAHHLATIQEYQNYGVAGVNVIAEWATGGNACPECTDLEGKEFTLQEIRDMIPRHPNCRCVALPKIAPIKKS